MPVVRVHTTQNVTLAYEAASIGDRIVAQLLDYLVLFAWGAAWAALLSWAGKGGSNTPSHSLDYHKLEDLLAMLFIALIMAPYFFYTLACEVFFNGQTLGKKARHLRVVRLDGTAPRLGDFLLRWLLSPVEILFSSGAIAVITIVLNGKGQRLGDLAAGTTVVNLRPRARQLVDVVSAAQPTGYQPVFPQAARLTDHDVNLLHQLLSRSLRQQNFLLLHETAYKVKALLNVHSDLSDEAFLHTVLRDHSHLAMEGELMQHGG